MLTTIIEIRGRVTAPIFEIKALMEDLRMQLVGGFVGGLDLWEMAVIPMLLNNADMWTEIGQEAIKELEKLQSLFLSVMFAVPASSPRPLLCWDTVTRGMDNRVKEKKLNLLVHVKNLENSSLAKQIYDEQCKQEWPGLVKECKEICDQWKIMDVTRVWQKEPTVKEWKRKIKAAVEEANESELRDSMGVYEKLEDVIYEDYELKPYIQSMNLYDARMMFRVRARMVKCKMNFSSDKGNSGSLWRCESCMSNIDTQSHVLWCPAYAQFREGKSLSSSQDLVEYFRKVLAVRDRLNLEMKGGHVYGRTGKSS